MLRLILREEKTGMEKECKVIDTVASGKLTWMCSGITGTDQDSSICPGHSMTTKSGTSECLNLHFTLAKEPEACAHLGFFSVSIVLA